MSIIIHRFVFDWDNGWDEFVCNKAKNATVLHSRGFFNHNESNLKDDCSFVFTKANVIVGLFPANLYLRGEQLILHSYLRSTYGGLVYSDDSGMIDLLEMLDQLIEKAGGLGVSEI